MLLGVQDDGVEQGDDENGDQQRFIPVVTGIVGLTSLVFYHKVDDADGDDVEADDNQCADGDIRNE